MFDYPVNGRTGSAYLALPERGEGPGVLVFHAWWGLTDFFKQFSDRLADQGFVALAPDLYHGRTAATVEQAEALMAARDFDADVKEVQAAVDFLRRHPAVRGEQIGAVGFSAGGAWTLLLATSLRPESVSAAVTFYGLGDGDYANARADFLGHFAEQDDYESLEDARQVEAEIRAAGRPVEFHVYPGTGHWFFESDRPDAYNAAAASLAWERTVRFLRERLGP
jgi:carboxymethylenebutenolidase